MSTMKTNPPQDPPDKTALEREFEADIVRILLLSDTDLEGALLGIDYFLERNPHPAFQNALLAWKGTFYLEHGRYDEAVRELRAADALDIPEDFHQFNTKYELAKALDLGGHPEEAYSVLLRALHEIETPSLQFDVLCALAFFCWSLGHPLPERAELALKRGKAFYEIDDQGALPDLMSEIERVAVLQREASSRYSEVTRAVRHTENPDEKLALIDAYLQNETVIYYKKLAGDLRNQVISGA